MLNSNEITISLLTMLWHMIMLSLAVSAMSITVTKSSLFRGFRLSLKSKSEFLGKMFSCSYCFSHWISALVIIGFHTQFVMIGGPIDNYAISIFALIALSNIITGIILRSNKFVTGTSLMKNKEESA